MGPISLDISDRRPARAGLRLHLRPLAAAVLDRPLRSATSGSSGSRPPGEGAAARFRVDAPGGIGYMETVIAERRAPAQIVENGPRRAAWTGSAVRTNWELTGGEGGVTERHAHLLDRARQLARPHRASCGRPALVEAALAPRAAAPARRSSSPAPSPRAASAWPAATGSPGQTAAADNPALRGRHARSPRVPLRRRSPWRWAPRPAARRRRADGEEIHSVVEGEPLELGDLHVNVQLTRFLNPNDTEDAEYLEGLPAPPPGEDYLAVFMEVENEGDEHARAAEPPSEIEIEDTTGEVYPSGRDRHGLRARPGRGGPGGETVPADDTAAASGPVQGAIVLFLVTRGVYENRPLEMRPRRRRRGGHRRARHLGACAEPPPAHDPADRGPRRGADPDPPARHRRRASPASALMVLGDRS